MQSAWFIASILRCAPRQVVIAEPLAALEAFLRESADTEEPRILAQLVQVLGSRTAKFANQDLLSLRGEALDLGAALIEAWIRNRYGSDEWAQCGVYKAAMLSASATSEAWKPNDTSCERETARL